MLNAYLQLVPLDDSNSRGKDGDDVDDKIRRKRRRKVEKKRDGEEDNIEVTGFQNEKDGDQSSDDSSFSDDEGIIDQRSIYDNNNNRKIRFSIEQLKMLKKEIRTEQENQLLQQILSNHRFFKNIQQEISCVKYSQLFSSIQFKIFQACDPVFEVNNIAKEFYIILSGSVLVLSPNINQNSALQQQQDSHQMNNNQNISQRALLDKKIASQYPNCQIFDHLKSGDSFGEVGEHFGEISSRTDRKRTTNVVCRKTCQMAVISLAVFDEILSEYYQRIWKEKEKTIRSSEIFRNATRSFTTSIAMNIRRRIYHLDDIVYEEGSASTTLFLVKNGEVELSKKAIFESNKTFLNSSKPPERIIIAQKTHNDCFGEVEMVLEIPRDTRVKCVSSNLEVYCISQRRLYQCIGSQNADDFLENLQKSAKQIMKWRKQHYASMIKQILDLRDPFHRTFSSYEVGKQLFNLKFKKDFMNNQLQDICKVSKPEETEFTAKKVYFNNVRAYASKLNDVLGTISNLKQANSSIQNDNQNITDSKSNLFANRKENNLPQGKIVSSISQKSQDSRCQELKSSSLPHISSRLGSNEVNIRRQERSSKNNLRQSISTNISISFLNKLENNSSLIIQEQPQVSSPLKNIQRTPSRNASFAWKKQRNQKNQHCIINSLDCLPHIQDPSLAQQSNTLNNSSLPQTTPSKIQGQFKIPGEQAACVGRYQNKRSSSQYSSNDNSEEQIIQRLLSQKKEQKNKLDSNLETADSKQGINQSHQQQNSFLIKSSLVSASSSNLGELNPMRLELSQLKKRLPFSMCSSPVKSSNLHSPYFSAVLDQNYLENLYDKISNAKYISTQSQETNKKMLKEGMVKYCLQQRKPKRKESNDEDFTNLHQLDKFKLSQVDPETEEIVSKIRFMSQLQLRQTLQRKYINSSLHKDRINCSTNNNNQSLQISPSIDVLESNQSFRNISRKQSSSLHQKNSSSALFQEPIISIKQININ